MNINIDINSWKDLLAKVINDIMDWLPSLLGALLLIIAGWIIAHLLRFILGGILRRIGIDKIAEKAGAVAILTSWGFKKPMSSLIARFVYWVIFFLFLMAATELLGLNFVAEIFQTFVRYLPRLLAALLILLLGGFFAGLIGDATGSFAKQSGVKTGPFIGQIVKYTLFIIVFIVALQELGVETVLLSSVIIIITASLALAISLAFGLGSRELAHNIISGFHARESFVPGAEIQVQEYSGKLIRIGTFKFVIETEQGRISLPNHILTEEKILVFKSPIKNETNVKWKVKNKEEDQEQDVE